MFTIAGCFKLARTTPPLAQYVLGGGQTMVSAPSVAAAPDTGGVTIGLRRMDIAPYLATPAIVVRRGTQIVTSQFHRWGEDPGAGIPRAIAEYLAATRLIRAVDIAPWSVRTQHDYLAQVHVSRLEGVAPEDTAETQGEVHVSASWEILRSQDGALLARGETVRRETGWKVGDYPALVTLLDKGLSGVASDLAACIERIVQTVPRDSADVVRPMMCARAQQ